MLYRGLLYLDAGREEAAVHIWSGMENTIVYY